MRQILASFVVYCLLLTSVDLISLAPRSLLSVTKSERSSFQVDTVSFDKSGRHGEVQKMAQMFQDQIKPKEVRSDDKAEKRENKSGEYNQALEIALQEIKDEQTGVISDRDFDFTIGQENEFVEERENLEIKGGF